MNYKTIIIDTLLILICIVPFFLFAFNKKRRKNQLFGKINQMASASGLKISKFDIWDQSIIGLDETNSHVFFYRNKQGNELLKEIKIDEIKSCNKCENSRVVSGKNGKVKVIDFLSLHFFAFSDRQETIILEFYDNEDSPQLGDELMLIEKWHSILSSVLELKQQHSKHRHAG